MQDSHAQKQIDSMYLNFNFKFRDHIFKIDKTYVSKNDTLQINLLKFYASAIQIEYEDKTIFKENNSYHLIDIENPKSLKFAISKKNNKAIKKIKFCIGIDSLASVSGALSSDLDLQNGMYWSWQSGYINMKIEGKSPSSKTRKNLFQFHIGGYQKPYNAIRFIELKLNKKVENTINISMDLEKLFSEFSLNKTNSIMIPGKESMRIADLIAKIFYTE